MKKIKLSFFAVIILLLISKQGQCQYLSEGFETGILPVGWSEVITSTEQRNWLYQSGDYNLNISSAHTGSFNALFYDDTYGDYTPSVSKLITPSLDLSAATAPQLTFWHAQKSWGSDQDELRVYYKIFPGGTWILLPGGTFTSSISSWTKETINLPNLSATYYIAFEAKGKFGYGVVIDDISIDEQTTVGTSDEFTSFEKIFPNPCTRSFKINANFSVDETLQDVEIFDLLGNLVKKTKPTVIGKNVYEIDIANINTGMYYLVYKSNSKINTKKFIIQ